jgi:hypothetical protein
MLHEFLWGIFILVRLSVSAKQLVMFVEALAVGRRYR